MSERVGEQFRDYRLTRRLGGGTFGDVYLGEHTGNKTPAAIKVLQARLIHSEDLKDYINEIRSLFLLQHPNIVPLLDFGIERDIPFLIMAYAPNGTLRQPKGTRLPLDIAVAYIRQIAEALQHAHDLKLIHRDVKPDNILLGPKKQVWLSDFGIVSIAHSSRSLNTQDGAGTIPYMAPEQILGKPRLASDQYALGIIAYEWICGSRPFNGTAIEIAMQHAQAQPPSLHERVPTLPPAIEQVILQALAKDPKDRFVSVREFAEALAAAVEQSKPRPAPQKTEERLVPERFPLEQVKRHPETGQSQEPHPLPLFSNVLPPIAGRTQEQQRPTEERWLDGGEPIEKQSPTNHPEPMRLGFPNESPSLYGQSSINVSAPGGGRTEKQQHQTKGVLPQPLWNSSLQRQTYIEDVDAYPSNRKKISSATKFNIAMAIQVSALFIFALFFIFNFTLAIALEIIDAFCIMITVIYYNHFGS